MFNCIWSPRRAIEKAEDDKSFWEAYSILLIGLVSIAISVIISLKKVGYNLDYDFRFFRWVFFFLFCLILICIAMGIFLSIIVSIFQKRSGIFEGIATVSMGIYITGLGLLISTVIFYLIPEISIAAENEIVAELLTYLMIMMHILSSAILVFSMGGAYAVMMKAALEFYKMNLLTAFVIMSIMFTSWIMVWYFIFMRLVLSAMSTVGVRPALF